MISDNDVRYLCPTRGDHSQKLLLFLLCHVFVATDLRGVKEPGRVPSCVSLSSAPALSFINHPSFPSLSFSNGK